jgi:hypothetical protein
MALRMRLGWKMQKYVPTKAAGVNVEEPDLVDESDAAGEGGLWGHDD